MVEIVEGTVYMSPQRDTHWEIIAAIYEQLRTKYPRKRVKSDVRIDYHWSYEDVEFVAEVISKGTAANDYGPKKAAYATAEVPVYVIADPCQGRCHIYTAPKGSD